MPVYAIPDLYKPIAGVDRPYERGTYVGLTNATRAELNARSTLVSVTGAIPGSTKRVAGHMNGRTTATLTSGNNTIVVASAANWAVGYGLVLGFVAKIKITAGAASSGEVKFILHSHEYATAVAAGDTVAQVATKIASTAWRGQTDAPVNNGDGTYSITFRGPSFEKYPGDGSFDVQSNGTGVVFAPRPSGSQGTARVEIPWTGAKYEVAAISGNNITLTPIADFSGSGDVGYTGAGVLVRHDDGMAINQFVAALSDGQVLDFPSNAQCEIHTGWSISRSNVTVRGNGSYQETWSTAPSPSMGGGTSHSANTVITSGKGRGSQTLIVESSAGYATGNLVKLFFGNDYTLPVLSGYDTNDKEIRGPMEMLVIITGVPNATSITIDRPLPLNFSSVFGFVSNAMGLVSKSSLEGFVVEAINSRAVEQGGMYGVHECRWRDVKVSNGRSFMCGMRFALRAEWTRVYMDRIPGYSTNKFGVGWTNATGCLIEDCILYNMVNMVQGNSGLLWCAFHACAIVVSTDGSSLANGHFNFNHGAHPAFVCVEACWIQSGVGFEGYHGGTSHHTVWRNHLGGVNGSASEFSVCVDIRAKCRHILLGGNQLQDSGYNVWVNDGIDPNGYPNYNSTTNGNTSINNDWPDLAKFLAPATGSLSGGVLTVTSDYFEARHGPVTSPGYLNRFRVIVDKQHRYYVSGYTNARTVNVYAEEGSPPASFTNLPVALWPVSGENGFQERDLETAATLLRVGNTSVFSNGMPAVDAANLGSDTLQDSLIYPSRPDWLDTAQTELGLTFEWPPFGPRTGNPGHRNESISAIPAGARFVATIPPQFTGAQINAAGTQLLLTFNKAVFFGPGGNGGVVISNALAPTTASYLSGSGTSTLVYSLSRVVYEVDVEQPRVAYTQPTAGIRDNLNNDAESWAARSINNGSNVSVPEDGYQTGTPEEATDDIKCGAYSSLHTVITVAAPMTVNKLRFYIGTQGSQPAYNGPKVALMTYNSTTGDCSMLSEGIMNYTGENRWCSANITPVHIAAGQYVIAVRANGGGPNFRSKPGGISFDISPLTEGAYFAGFGNVWPYIAPFSPAKTIIAAVRGVLDVPPPAAPGYNAGKTRTLRRR